MSRYIPAEVRRILRQEANFGCAYCGTPLIQYHHIIPYSEEEHHDPDHMIALCPTCHSEADAGTIKRAKLYDLKTNPEISDRVDHDFYFAPENPVIKLGSTRFEFTGPGKWNLLKWGDEPLITASFEEGILKFDISFYSKEGRLIAEISENEWWSDTNQPWDISYKRKHLKIWNSDGEVGLKIEYDTESDDIYIKGKFYYDPEAVFVHPSKIIGPGSQIIEEMTIQGEGFGSDDEYATVFQIRD